jgi:hypothetical protein
MTEEELEAWGAARMAALEAALESLEPDRIKVTPTWSSGRTI